jgi:hypothetical protein
VKGGLSMMPGPFGSTAGLVHGPRLRELLPALEADLDRPTSLYLVGESSLVLAGAREWTDRVVYTTDAADPGSVDRAFRRRAGETGVEVERESPGDVIPLPAGFEGRARVVDDWRRPGRPAVPTPARLRVLHFDPVSVAFRLIARGDEPDYHVVLAFLERGWLDVGEMDRCLADVLPRFSARTLQQDPAEFRRKYKGLVQMWRARAFSGAGAGR